MKILIVSNNLNPSAGGAAAVACDEIRALLGRQHQVFVFTLASADQQGQELSGVTYYYSPFYQTRYLFRQYVCLRRFRVEREFRHLLETLRPDIIHFHNLYYELPFSLLKIARHAGTRVYYTAHDVMTFSPVKLNNFVNAAWTLDNIDSVNYHLSFFERLRQGGRSFNPSRNFFIRYYLKHCHKIITVSRELQKALAHNGIANTLTIHNPISPLAWAVDANEVGSLRQNLGLTGKKIILFAGRLSGNKGGGVLLSAFSSIVAAEPQARLLILGERNNYVQTLLAQGEVDGLSDYIIFNGPVKRDQMKLYYYLSDVVVVPSICFDSYPTINLEAFACGKPVVSTIFGGSREIVVDGKNGFLVNPLKFNELSDRIISLLKNASLRETFGRAGLASVNRDGYSALNQLLNL
ncbi:MAG TPA: glycosyltransferase family 4 protein [bacterium]|mgnify:CR=1 FL=1|nr:glycosyltransferase family 4 protein [bacterium]